MGIIMVRARKIRSAPAIDRTTRILMFASLMDLILLDFILLFYRNYPATRPFALCEKILPG